MSFDWESESESEHEVELFTEKVELFPSYATASVASCKWVNEGKEKINPAKLELYTSRLPASPAHGKVVGLGLRTPAGVIVPYVRLDMDNTGKGIHFNATQLSHSDKKLAAVIKSSVHLTPGKREDLYLDYIKGIHNRSAEFIWKWWSTGHAPV